MCSLRFFVWRWTFWLATARKRTKCVGFCDEGVHDAAKSNEAKNGVVSAIVGIQHSLRTA